MGARVATTAEQLEGEAGGVRALVAGLVPGQVQVGTPSGVEPGDAATAVARGYAQETASAAEEAAGTKGIVLQSEQAQLTTEQRIAGEQVAKADWIARYGGGDATGDAQVDADIKGAAGAGEDAGEDAAMAAGEALIDVGPASEGLGDLLGGLLMLGGILGGIFGQSKPSEPQVEAMPNFSVPLYQPGV